jgi:hypothetical protein
VQHPYPKDTRVRWQGRAGTVAYVRMAPPDWREAASYSIVLDDQRHRTGYAGTVVPASELELEKE